MSEDASTGIQQEGAEAFSDLEQAESTLAKTDEAENENSEESSPESNDSADSPSQKGEEESSSEDDSDSTSDDSENVPLNKQPRFKEVISQNRELKSTIDDLTTSMEELKSGLSDMKSSQPEQVPQAFIDLYGEGATAETWAKFKQLLPAMDKESLRREVVDEMKAQAKSEDTSNQKWTDWINSEVKELKDAGERFDKNALLKVMEDFTPSNEEGNLDFKKGLKILQMQKDDKSEAKAEKKKIAAQTTSESTAETSKSKIPTSKDLRNVDWNDLIN